MGKRVLGAVTGLVALSVLCGGTAYADNADDKGPNRGASRRTEARQSARQDSDRKPPSQSPADKRHASDLAASGAGTAQVPDRQEVESAASVRLAAEPDLEAMLASAVSPAVSQAVLGPGGNVPTVGMGGLVPNARALAAYIASTYPGVQAIGGVRSDPLPDHPSGHAIDIMVGSDMGLGDVINADVQSQAGRFGVVYTLWRVANHYNHVHVTVA